MTNGNTTNKGASPIVPQAAQQRKDFETLKRDFERLIASGEDYTAALLELSTAIAAACINKCIDPQRKNAAERDSGNNPAPLDRKEVKPRNKRDYTITLTNLRRGIFHDLHLLDDTRTAAAKATNIRFNASGDIVTETADPDALVAFGELIGETLSDGLDLVHTAAVALLEQAAEHADPAAPWLDTPYTVRRLARKVYIRRDDSAAYRDEQTTPIQEAYKEVRRAIQNSRAAQTDPRNGYTYIEDMTADGLDTIYHRLQKWADLGGADCYGRYTADHATVDTCEKTLATLDLNDRQLVIVNLRMRGYGKKAIGKYLGIDPNNVGRVLHQIQAKAEKIGFTPAMWLEMTTED